MLGEGEGEGEASLKYSWREGFSLGFPPGVTPTPNQGSHSCPGGSREASRRKNPSTTSILPALTALERKKRNKFAWRNQNQRGKVKAV